MRKISPFLWFNDNAEEAVKFYTSIFGDSIIDRVVHYGELGPRPEGTIMTLGFQLEGQDFAALNGGPVFSFTPAISFFVSCTTESDLDALWQKLSGSGTVYMPMQEYPFSRKFGWVADRFGLSWQLNLAGTRKEIAPCLMFVGTQFGKAEEAMKRYVSVFKNSGIQHIERYAAGEPGPEGSVKLARFTLDGREFMAMDSAGAHAFTFTPATSFFVNCETQQEIDEYWDKLSEGGKTGQCGWLEDRYGISWQIVPSDIGELMADEDRARARRVTEAMLKMNKLDIAALRRAYDGDRPGPARRKG
jgi:predicted 3-demethylubiquinone-9 3-methyltransferase (glyoxalase superfamily)